MESQQLHRESMRTLIQHPAWQEFMRSYLIPHFEWFENASRQATLDRNASIQFSSHAEALRGVIEKPYEAAEYNSPLQRRYDFDEEILSTPKETKRKYTKRKGEDESPVSLPQRSSFAV